MNPEAVMSEQVPLSAGDLASYREIWPDLRGRRVHQPIHSGLPIRLVRLTCGRLALRLDIGESESVVPELSEKCFVNAAAAIATADCYRAR